MSRTILVYGVIIGAIIIGISILTLALGIAMGQVWLGFLVMIVAFSAIFFAVKQYRDQRLGGVIRFGTAAMLGIGIAAVASVIYVGVWEVYLYATDYSFADAYAEYTINDRRAGGAGESELATVRRDMDEFRVSYANPLIRVPITFLEIFPVGLVMALIAAAALRTRRRPEAVA
jgi:hypothetical protein